MSKIIYKYPLTEGINPIQLPIGSVICHVGQDPDKKVAAIWIELDMKTTEMEKRLFAFVPTGILIESDPTHEWKFIGTAICAPWVWHVHELIKRTAF